MPAKRITMRNIREVLRLRLAAGLSLRQIRHSTKISLGAVQKLSKYFLFILVALGLLACSEPPKCKFTGDSDDEANAGCLVIYNNKVLIIEDYNGLFSLPGGGKNAGEIPQCTAEREVWEETGIEVKANRRLETFNNGFQLFSCEVVRAQVTNAPAKPWQFEVAAIHWIGDGEFGGKKWRFPEQVELIEKHLRTRLKAD